MTFQQFTAPPQSMQASFQEFNAPPRFNAPPQSRATGPSLNQPFRARRLSGGPRGCSIVQFSVV